MNDDTHLHRDTPATYQIYLQGALDESWSEFLQGMTIVTVQMPGGAPVTSLSGELVDQAALFGVLNLVYDLGLSVLLVKCMNAERRYENQGI